MLSSRRLLLCLIVLLAILPTQTFAAIAFDGSSSADGSGTSLNDSHSIFTSSNTALVIGVAINRSVDDVTSVMDGATALTRLDANTNSQDGYTYCYVEPPPLTSGSHTITVNASVSIGIDIRGVSLTGVLSSSFPDAHKSDGTGSSASSFTTSITTVSNNDWVVVMAQSDHGALSAGSGLTLRTAGTATNIAILDSNSAQTPPGSHSFTVDSTSGSSDWGICDVALAPVASASPAAAAYYNANWW